MLDRMSDHLQTAALVPIWAAVFASMVGAAIAIFAGVFNARQPNKRGFDFVASARRIRAGIARSN